MSIIEVKNVSKVFHQGKCNVWALNHCCMEVEEGEFVAIMGTSGSGKSTLLNVCGGLHKPTEGEVLFEGKSLAQMSRNELAELRRVKLGFVYQSYELVPIMTAYENIILPTLLDHKKPDKVYVEEIAKELHIDDRLHHFPGAMSGGEQQRVAIARAIINRPKVLLADEPTGNLDKENAEEVLRMLEEMVRKYNITLVMITHDSNIAKRADRILYMENGELSNKR